jgi:molecular chaperone GrpE
VTEATLKEQLVERFRRYLDVGDIDLGESPSDAEAIDLYTLFTELAALKTEVKLESRQVKQALDVAGELIEGLRQNNHQLSTELSRRRQEEDETRQAAERPLLLAILELRDRLRATLVGLRVFKPGSIGKRKTKRFIASMDEGLEISLRRLDGVLHGYQVRAMDPVGKPVDPQTMTVTAIESRKDRDSGVVLEEVRQGFLRGEQVLRLAEVIVNKHETRT